MSKQTEFVYDQLLVLRCKDGEADALEELVKRWQQRLWRHAQRLTCDPEAASDAMQEAWLAIVKGIKRLNDPAHFRAWSYRIVTNKCADWIRRQQHRRKNMENRSDFSEPIDSSSDQDTENDEISKLQRALQRLPSDRYTLLAMFYLDQMSVAEIAVALDIPRGTVKSRLHAARNELKEVIERSE